MDRSISKIAKRLFCGAAVLICILFLIALLLPSVGAPEYYYSVDQALNHWPRSSVNKLALIDQDLLELPVGVRQLAGLEKLIVYGNKISELPDWLPENSMVIEIWLDDNEFSSFPVILTQMPNLEVLTIKRNAIPELPPSIGNLRTLEDLDLSHNQLTDLPNEISQLTALKWLELDGNRFSLEAQEKVRRLLPHTDIDFGKQRER